VRAQLAAKTQTLASAFHSIDTSLDGQRNDLNLRIQSEVTTINRTAAEIDDLNHQISNVLTRGVSANDLLDRRDQLVSELSGKIGLQITTQDNGSVSLYVGSRALVDETGVNELSTAIISGDPNGMVNVVWKESGASAEISSGELNGYLTARDVLIPGVAADLDTLARGLINAVNAVHRTGLGLDGSTGITGSTTFTGALATNGSVTINGTQIDLYAGDDLTSIVGRLNAQETTTGVHASVSANRLVLAPSGTNGQTVKIDADPDGVLYDMGILNDFFSGTGADDIALSSAVENNNGAIAASASGAPGDNTTALALLNLRNQKTLANGTRSFDDFYQEFVSDLGTDSEAAVHQNDNQDYLLDQIDNLRDAVSGVSLDEEMTDLMKYQRSYEMAAKIIATADEMLDTLLKMV
jgi:flagellar hook-associated protein 1 FlgK